MNTRCPKCWRLTAKRGRLVGQSEDVTEKLDVAPAQFRVLAPRRRTSSSRPRAQAQLIEGGLPTGRVSLRRGPSWERDL